MKLPYSMTVSGFKSKTYLPDDASIPLLFALENPTFVLFSITRVSGNFLRTISIELSTELLSTTNTSPETLLKAL